MQATFEKLGGTYRQEGDYLLPNVEVPESPAIGIWGQRRHKYQLEHNHALYTALFLSGKLTAHLEEIDRTATKFGMSCAVFFICDHLYWFYNLMFA